MILGQINQEKLRNTLNHNPMEISIRQPNVLDSISTVTIIGTGLVGTSVALALRNRGVKTLLYDRDEEAMQDAIRRGAGSLLCSEDGPADLVVIATPPAAVAETLLQAQNKSLGTAYTDVASLKNGVIQAATTLGCDLRTYIPGHPIAGGERSGPAAARSDLFMNRTWIFCPNSDTSPEAIALGIALATLTGSKSQIMDSNTHDHIMALVSHAPHLLSSAMAAQLADASDIAVELVGTGLRDVTRIAAGDIALWTEILSLNADFVAQVLDTIADNLYEAAGALRLITSGDDEAKATIIRLLTYGNTGRHRISFASS